MQIYKSRVCLTCKQTYTRQRGNDSCPSCTPPRPCADCQQPYYSRVPSTQRCLACMDKRRERYRNSQRKNPARLHTFNPDNIRSFYFYGHEEQRRREKLRNKLEQVWRQRGWE